ncbi:hypothetical protein ACFPYJ_20005 [Paenibacillus solisilvae]|uniref:Uncharacterized protein n=1 Tax=Paenibacillus solisilvae TaxID=2486751 RepID=A0ABW0W072_9BACL
MATGSTWPMIRKAVLHWYPVAVLAAVSLGFFNLIFVLGPFIALLGVLIALWAASLSLGLSAFAAVYEGVFGKSFTIPQSASAAAVLLGLGMLLGAGTHSLTRAVARMTLQYLKFNSRMIRVKKG